MKWTPLARKSPLKRGIRVKPVNKARKAKNTERAYGPPERRAWLVRQPCCVCGSVSQDGNHQHHTRNGGKGRKADADTLVSLCHTCHRLYHDGRLANVPPEFWERQAAQTEAAWRLYRLCANEIEWGEDA